MTQPASAPTSRPDNSGSSARKIAAARNTGRKVATTALAASGIVALLLGGYTAAVALTPLPEAIISIDAAAATQTLDPAAAQATVDAQDLPTAIGWLEGEEVWTNDPEPQPLASLSKMVTVLVGLEQRPLEAGSDGFTHVWTAEDARQQEEYLAMDGVAFPIPVGTEVTQRQMLTLIFLPSANDFAAAYADSIFGDNASYLSAVEDWKVRHDLDSLTMAEPTGMDEANTASAADVLRIARLVLNNPAAAEFTQMSTAELPWGIGVVENTNPLVATLPGVIGVKTGASSSAGYNLAVAQQIDVLGRNVTQLAVTLGRASKEDRAQSGRDALRAIALLPQETEVVAENEAVGTVTTVQGDRIPLLAERGSSSVLLPGESAERSVTLQATTLPVTATAGTRVGTIPIESPTGRDDIPVVTAETLTAPDFWWRVTHPVEVFGWG
ncbi:hypothetical protein G7067_01785 [Leucobacter insecticola]|uniref:Peptidase S11 D-alanyl-D-alanine carboxypeptidase A N-terminal domain-containing protein n=1 Tax=Leucobacter insecticola TaxID=2714934 RepID=A0A6G8FHB2_9MICO|nr:hypothetical protein [Leucobacter insecticola]QIM15422.1 hypothetical protein G7067_01785 [Leucobacter insecticola]